MIKNITILVFSMLLCSTFLFGGNPDRQGEAGAYELIMNPWARSAGLHTMNTAGIRGVEAMRLNVAGLSRIEGTELLIGHTIYLAGTDIGMNAIGIAQKVGEKGTFGLSIMALDIGDIAVTTTESPEGTGATFSPNFVNIGLSYAHLFENKVSVGVTLRGISESTADLQAFGFAIDAGVQYVTGDNDEFKFGISLRNVGSPMNYKGEGLSRQVEVGGTVSGNTNTLSARGASFELPSVLNIGLSYDFPLSETNKITVLGNFTSNSFSEDQLGIGAEFSLGSVFQLRAAYKYTNDSSESSGIDKRPVYTGLAAGLSVVLPFKKGGEDKFGIDYGYRASNPWDGSHSIAIRLNF